MHSTCVCYLSDRRLTCIKWTKQDVEPRYYGDNFRWPSAFYVRDSVCDSMRDRVFGACCCLSLSFQPFQECDGDVRLTTCCSSSVTHTHVHTHIHTHIHWSYLQSLGIAVGLWTLIYCTDCFCCSLLDFLANILIQKVCTLHQAKEGIRNYSFLWTKPTIHTIRSINIFYRKHWTTLKHTKLHVK